MEKPKDIVDFIELENICAEIRRQGGKIVYTYIPPEFQFDAKWAKFSFNASRHGTFLIGGLPKRDLDMARSLKMCVDIKVKVVHNDRIMKDIRPDIVIYRSEFPPPFDIENKGVVLFV